jgi:predicted nuclease with TOPRIM domain
MTIDKQKLQKLLWAEAASYRADCADWKRNTEALQEFLGEKTVEEAALDLLAENEQLRADKHTVECRLEVSEDTLGCIRGCLRSAESEIDQIKAENEALRKDAELLQNAADFVQKLCDSAGKQPSVATGYLHDILSTMGKDGRS